MAAIRYGMDELEERNGSNFVDPREIALRFQLVLGNCC